MAVITSTRKFILYYNDEETIKEHGLLYSDTLHDDGVRDVVLLITGQRFVGTCHKDSISTLFKCYRAADEWLDLMYNYKSGNQAIMQAYIGEPNYHIMNLPVCGHERTEAPTVEEEL